MIIRGRWYWTDNKVELVPEGDVRAAFLAYPDGEEVGDAEAAKLGLAAKMERALSDKMAKTAVKTK